MNEVCERLAMSYTTPAPSTCKAIILRCGDVDFKATRLSALHELKRRFIFPQDDKFYERLNMSADFLYTLYFTSHWRLENHDLRLRRSVCLWHV
jgi:hypothetical protein